MPVTVGMPVEKYKGTVRQVILGADSTTGGTRKRTVSVGGESTLPFLTFEGAMPNPPIVAVEITESAPAGWPAPLLDAWGDVVNDPAAWAAKAEAVGADVIVLQVADDSESKLSAADIVSRCKAVLQACGLPLVVVGPGSAERDNEILIAVAEATAGERLVVGRCEEANYRTIVAAAMANGHLVIGATPIDVNLAKQLNILIRDMNLPLDRVLMDPTTGALGYGLEYSYSVMERLRSAALQGDEMTQQPMICFAGHESWRQKEARTGQGVPTEWGNWQERAILWELTTATTLLQAGADIVVARHPQIVPQLHDTISQLMRR